MDVLVCLQKIEYKREEQIHKLHIWYYFTKISKDARYNVHIYLSLCNLVPSVTIVKVEPYEEIEHGIDTFEQLEGEKKA